MASSVWKGQLTFGLVSMPVRLMSAARSESISFNQLHKSDGSRIKQVIYCQAEDKPIPRTEIVKGYEYEKDRYVVIEDEEIKKVQLFIEKNLEEKITIEDLSDRFAIARRSLVRRFKKATNNPPIEYIQRIKIEAAKRKLEQKRKTVNEIMYSVGYTDEKAFRNVFKKITGLSPIEYRNKYNREMIAA